MTVGDDGAKAESIEDGESYQASTPVVLGFTDLRREELVEPLEAVDYDGVVVAVDPDRSMGARVVDQLRRGLSAFGRDGPDVVVVYNGSGVLGLASILLGWYYAVPTLVRVNGDVLRQHREKVVEYWRRGAVLGTLQYALLGAMTWVTFRLADGYLVMSRELADVVRRQTGAPTSRVAVVHNPVPDVRVDGDRESPVAVDREVDHLLLTVTNLDYRGKYRGVRLVVDAVLPALPEDVGYVVAGDGLYLDRLRSYVDETVDDPALRSRIYTPGYVDDVGRLYADADVFVYVSYIDGYPNAVLEAQSACLPVVANAAHGMVEQIDDGRTGRLIEPPLEPALADAVERLLESPAQRGRLAAAARDHVRRHNAPERVGREMVDAVETILDDVDRTERRGPVVS